MFELVYEPQLGLKQRGPDFAVQFTTSLTFTLEVTRLRPAPQTSLEAAREGLIEAICSKLGQLVAQQPNVLVIGLDDERFTIDELRSTLLQLQQRAERSDALIIERHRFRDRAEFFQQYGRLSEILVRDRILQSEARGQAWANPQARYPLPSKARTALYRSQNI